MKLTLNLLTVWPVIMAAVLLGCNGDDGPNGPSDDTTRPTIIGISPADSATVVQVSSVIDVSFSEPIDTNTINQTSFAVMISSLLIEGQFVFSKSLAGVIFTPNEPLEYNSIYRVTLSTDITDLAGNSLAEEHVWTFTTQTDPATTPPTIVSTNPAAGATNVSADQPVTATFSKTMNPATLTDASFFLSNGVTGVVSLTDSIASFTPDDTLDYETEYTATITTAVADTFGNYLTADTSWSFTTEADPRTPEGSIVFPLDDAIIGNTVTVLVSASATLGVERVEFYRNGMHIIEADDLTSPYSYTWDASTMTIGSHHTFLARIYDPEGRVAETDTIWVTYLWEELGEDIDDLWRADLSRVLTRSTDSMLELRVECSEAWTYPYPFYDEIEDTLYYDTAINLGIYLDTDQNGATGRQDFAGTNLNGIGAEYRVLISPLIGRDTSLAIWTTAWAPVYDTTGFAYHNVPRNTNILELGILWSDLDYPSGVDIVTINLFFFSAESFYQDWLPDNGSGHVTVLRQNRYVGASPSNTAHGRFMPQPPFQLSDPRPEPRFSNPFE